MVRSTKRRIYEFGDDRENISNRYKKYNRWVLLFIIVKNFNLNQLIFQYIIVYYTE